MENYYGIKYEQGQQDFIISVLPMKFIIDNYTVLIYGDDESKGEDPIYGYQRAPKPSHYKKICKELLKDINSQVSTNSIVLGINKNDFEENYHITVIDNNVNSNVIKMEPKGDKLRTKFRVIDGQHRIKGFEKAFNEGSNKEEIANYQVSVVIMLLDEAHRRPEVTAFTNINSKAKPLKMDLTKLAEYKYDLKEKNEEISIENYLIVSVIKHINDGWPCKYWTNGIIFDVNSTNAVGIVGLKGFYDTIKSMCINEIKDELDHINTINFDDKKQRLDQKAISLSKEIGECWNIVLEKWNVTTRKEMYDFGEMFEIYYDERYYLQKTIGVMAINQLITLYHTRGGVEEFKKVIVESRLTKDDWLKNGVFAGLSSAGGASKIVKYIKNEIID